MEGLGSINWWGFTPALDLQLGLYDDGTQEGKLSEGCDASGA